MRPGGRRSRKAPAVVVALAALAGLLLGACGSDEGSKSATTATTSGPGAKGTFRIGLEAPLTGSQAELGKGMLEGARFAAAEINADGGLTGRQVEIVAIDDQADPDVGERAAKEAIAAGLDAVVGPYNSGVGAKTLPLYIEAGLVPMRLTSADETAGLGFTLQPMTSQIAPVAVTATTAWGKSSSVGIIYDSTQEYTSKAARTMGELLPAAGVAVTSTVAIEPGSGSYEAALDAVLGSKPDMVYVVTYFPEAGVVAKDLAARDSGVKCLIDYGGFDNGYVTTAGVQPARRCDVVGVPAPSAFPGAESYVARFGEAMGSEPGMWSPYTYDSVRLLVDAVERAGSTEAAALARALGGTSGWKGWTGTVAFEAVTGNREPAPVTVNSVDSDGKFTVDGSWAAAVGFEF